MNPLRIVPGEPAVTISCWTLQKRYWLSRFDWRIGPGGGDGGLREVLYLPLTSKERCVFLYLGSSAWRGVGEGENLSVIQY